MSAATIRTELSANESGIHGRDTVTHAHATAAETEDMSPFARKVAYLSLLATAVFLGLLGAYVWYGFYQWQNVQ